MMKTAGVAMLILVGLGPMVAQADLIQDRPTLEALLGDNGILEDFETLAVPEGGQRSDSSGFLNSDSIFDGSGPGLVQPGATYSAPSLFWNGNNYFGLITQTLGDSTGWRDWQITIDFTTAVSAMGLDLQGYAGFGMEGTVSVFDTNNLLLSTTAVDGGFFGSEDVGGIGRVVVDTQIDNNYIMIDNHLYGIPEPSTIAILTVLGLAAVTRRRRI